MRDGLKVGEQVELSITVDERMRASLLGQPVHPLYGTAAMIEHMEWAARQHILPYLEPGEEGVGHHVAVKHLAPAPIGAVIRIQSTVSEIQPRRVTSQVKAWWESTLIGEGTLIQALVLTEKLYACANPQPAEGKHPAQPQPTAAEIHLEEASAPPPAQLKDAQGTVIFQLEVLRWENGMFACTRYDEWLVCRAVVGTKSGEATATQAEQVHHEGAFLLRYELEELLETMQALAQQTKTTYQSDFLEPLLWIALQPEGQNAYACDLQLTPPEQETQPRHTLIPLKALQQFAQQLSAQMEGFPSRL